MREKLLSQMEERIVYLKKREEAKRKEILRRFERKYRVKTAEIEKELSIEDRVSEEKGSRLIEIIERREKALMAAIRRGEEEMTRRKEGNGLEEEEWEEMVIEKENLEKRRS